MIILLTTLLMSCENGVENSEMDFLVNKAPDIHPIEFMQGLVPRNKLIHKGMFSPSLEEYYYTVSDINFEHFDVYEIHKAMGKWSKPRKAFFNSAYNEHGMSFSPDGNSLYFSSTRPVNIEGIAPTWHIWKSEKSNGKWDEPEFVDIPNLRNKLVSHPSATDSGTIYFHASNLDYSEMDIYYSKQVNGKFDNAEKPKILESHKVGKATPYISPKEDYLIFASIGDHLDLLISFSDGNGGWKNTRKLSDKINHLSQGNPYVTPNNKFLFFTTGTHSVNDWSVKWVNIEAEFVNFHTKP